MGATSGDVRVAGLSKAFRGTRVLDGVTSTWAPASASPW